MTATSRIKRVGREESDNFPTDDFKFPSEEITSAQKFNFIFNFFTTKIFFKFCILKQNFLTTRNRSEKLKFRGRERIAGPLPPFPLRCYCQIHLSERSSARKPRSWWPWCGRCWRWSE